MSTHDGITMQFNIFWLKSKLTYPQSVLSGATAARMNDRRPREGEGELMEIIWCYEIGQLNMGHNLDSFFYIFETIYASTLFSKAFLLKYLQHTLEIQCLIVHISCPKVYALLSFAVVGGLSKVNIYQSNSNGKKGPQREAAAFTFSALYLMSYVFGVLKDALLPCNRSPPPHK